MRTNKLRLVIPLFGTAAMAAVYVGVYHGSETMETAPGIEHALPVNETTNMETGHNPGQPESTPPTFTSHGGGTTHSLEKQLQPGGNRRRPGNWSRSLAVADETSFLHGSDLPVSGGAPAGPGSGAGTGAELDEPAGAEGSSGKSGGSSSSGGGAGGHFRGGAGGGLEAGLATNSDGSPVSFFLVSADKQNEPLVDLSPGTTDSGSDPVEQGGGEFPSLNLGGDNGEQVIPLVTGLTGKTGQLEQHLEQSVSNPGLTNGDESGDNPDEPKKNPPSDQPTSHKVPDTTSTLGLITLSMLGLAALRRRSAR